MLEASSTFHHLCCLFNFYDFLALDLEKRLISPLSLQHCVTANLLRLLCEEVNDVWLIGFDKTYFWAKYLW